MAFLDRFKRRRRQTQVGGDGVRQTQVGGDYIVPLSVLMDEQNRTQEDVYNAERAEVHSDYSQPSESDSRSYDTGSYDSGSSYSSSDSGSSYSSDSGSSGGGE